MSRPALKFIWTFAALFIAVIDYGAALPATAQPLTCDSSAIEPDSYALTTRAQALIVNADRRSWWEYFNVGNAFEDLYDLNSSSTWAAERALALDPGNLLAQGLLARQYVVTGADASLADQAWRAALDHGGAVVWTATLYDVDAKSYFLLAFDQHALRVYRYGELAGPFKTRLGLPTFVGEDQERFWRAWAGCIDPAARPEAVIPWSEVREIKAGNWVLYFKLHRKVTIASDRGKKKTLGEIKVNLHGQTGSIEVHTSVDSRDPRKVDVRTFGIGPLPYQNRIRYTLVKFIDPEGRITLPKASRSAGW